MQYVSSDIESHINQIEAIEMLKFNNENSSDRNTINANAKRSKCVAFIDDMTLPYIEMYFHSIYATKKSKKKYVNNLIESIGENLIKMEASILETRTGQSPLMELYYNFWENKLLKSLIGLVET